MTLISRLKLTATALLLVTVALFNVACSSDQLTVAIETAVDATAVALPLIGPAAGLSPELTAQISKYLTDVNTATVASAVVLDSTSKTSAEKWTEIAGIFAGIATVDLPPGTPANVAKAVQAVSDSIKTFLSQAQSVKAELQSPTPYFATSFAPRRPPPANPSKKRLKKLRQKAEENLRRLRGQ